MTPTVRRWWRGWLAAPVGTAIGLAVWAPAVLFTTARTSDQILDGLAGLPAFVAGAVLASYAAGVALLPVFLIFEGAGWRGRTLHVSTAIAVGLAGAVLIPTPAGLTVRALGASALCGALCGWVFSTRVTPDRV
jgi:hypothetical protein